MPIQPLGVRVRARIALRAAMFKLLTTRPTFLEQQRSGLNVAGTERSSVFVEMPPLIAEQTTRLALWMSTAKPSFLFKIKKQGATNLLDSEPIRKAMKMCECGDVLEVQSNGSGGVVAPLGALRAYAGEVGSSSRLQTGVPI